VDRLGNTRNYFRSGGSRDTRRRGQPSEQGMSPDRRSTFVVPLGGAMGHETAYGTADTASLVLVRQGARRAVAPAP
jgi:hypothetical protein